jgi:LCP family protein required for cell wall assembly
MIFIASFTGVGVVTYNIYDAFSNVERIEIKEFNSEIEIPKASSTKTFLLFSVGSEGLEYEEIRRTGVGKARGGMLDGLTDSIMVVIANPNTHNLGILSIPRDLWLDNKGSRINEVYKNYGVLELVREVEDLTSLPIDHVIKSNFAGFVDLVDLVGGIDVELDYSAKDDKAKLLLEKGCNNLSGEKALAFARSRHWKVSYDGVNFRSDRSSSDFGRIERQQYVLTQLANELKNPLLITKVNSIFSTLAGNVALDTNLTVREISSWLVSFSKGVGKIEKRTIQGIGFTTEQGASVLQFDRLASTALAQELLDETNGLITEQNRERSIDENRIDTFKENLTDYKPCA